MRRRHCKRHPYLVGRERLHSSTKSRTGSILLRSRRTAKIRSPWEGPSTASRSQHRQQRERQQHKREFPIDLRCCQPQPFRWLHRAGGAVAGADEVASLVFLDEPHTHPAIGSWRPGRQSCRGHHRHHRFPRSPPRLSLRRCRSRHGRLPAANSRSSPRLSTPAVPIRLKMVMKRLLVLLT